MDYDLYMTGNGGPANAGNYIETARIAIFRSHKRKWVVFGVRSEFDFNRSINWVNTDVTFVLHRSRVVTVPWVWCNRLGTVTVTAGFEKHRDYRDLKDKLLTEKSLKIPTFWKFMSTQYRQKTFNMNLRLRTLPYNFPFVGFAWHQVYKYIKTTGSKIRPS